MAQHPPPASGTSAIHPLDFLKDEWHLSRQSVHVDDLVVLHDLQPPSELAQPSLTHHMLAINLSHGSRQITRMDGQEYDGEMPIGKFFLLPACCPTAFAWETTDEALIFRNCSTQ